jgi:hypothetical protein
MRLLLDTHTFLWLDGSPERLSPAALAACEEPTNALYLSVVSAWEIQIKHQINRGGGRVTFLYELARSNFLTLRGKVNHWCFLATPKR